MKAVAKAGQSRAVLFGRRCVRYAADMAGGQRILIVVGGTAGWLAAAYLARSLGRSVRITLLESPEIGTIGVGEGTFPTIRDTLRFLGIDEASFVRRASATFKQGVRFTGWQPSVGDRPHSYFRPFEPPFGAEEASLVPHWLLQDEATRPPVAEAVTIQNRVADAKRAPKQPGEATSPGRSTTPSISTRRNCRACPPIAPGNWEWRIWPVA